MRDGTPKPKRRRGGIVSYRGVEYRKTLIAKNGLEWNGYFEHPAPLLFGRKPTFQKKDGEIALLNILL